jgi:hypothetical protein
MLTLLIPEVDGWIGVCAVSTRGMVAGDKYTYARGRGIGDVSNGFLAEVREVGVVNTVRNQVGDDIAGEREVLSGNAGR